MAKLTTAQRAALENLNRLYEHGYQIIRSWDIKEACGSGISMVTINGLLLAHWLTFDHERDVYSLTDAGRAALKEGSE